MVVAYEVGLNTGKKYGEGKNRGRDKFVSGRGVHPRFKTSQETSIAQDFSH